MKNILSNIFLN